LVFGVWCLVFGVWRLAFGVWRLAFGVWRLAFGVWRLAFGVTIHSSDGIKLPVCGPSNTWAHAPIRIDSEILLSADVDEFARPPQQGSSSIGLGENVKKPALSAAFVRS
jgi:hypothetical protein